jgi:branched-chain amino acid transport system substrate-binding protein
MPRRSSFDLRVFLLMLLVLPAACGGGRSAGTELTMVVVTPRTGPLAAAAISREDGIKLAVADVNARGGIHGHPVRLVLLDDENKREVAAQRAREVAAENKALVVFGIGTSDTSIAGGAIYKEAKIPAITANGATEITKDNPWYFRVYPDANYQSAVLATYAKHVLGAKAVRIVADQSAVGQSMVKPFKAAAEKLGLTVALELAVPSGKVAAEKMAEIAQQAAAGDRDAPLLLSAVSDQAALFLQALRDAGDRGTVLGGGGLGNQGFGDSFKDLPAEKRKPGFYTEGVITTAVALDDTAGEAAQRFYKRYEEAYRRKADGYAAIYYDAAVLALRGLDQTQATGADIAADRARLAAWLRGFSSPDADFPGTTGRFYFDADRNAIRSVPIGRFSGGRFVAAPVQLELLRKPELVPNFEADLKTGQVIPFGDAYMAKVQVVYVGMDVVAIPEINQRTAEFTAEFFVWLRYQGELKVKDLEFTNATKPISLGDPVWERKQGDLTVATYRVRGTFRAEFDYKDYPLDHQRLLITLRHRTRTANTFIVAIDRLGMSMKDIKFDDLALDKLRASFAATQWKPVSSLVFQDMQRSDSTLGQWGLAHADTGLEYSQINTEVEVKRDVASYLIKNLLPLVFILLVLYASNFVPPDQLSVRASMAITGLLTSMVLYQRASADLPAIGYLVLLDYGFFLAFGLALLQVGFAILAYMASKSKNPRPAKVLRAVGMFLLPTVVAISALAVGVSYGRG